MKLSLTGKIIALLLFTVALLTLAISLTVHISLLGGLNTMRLLVVRRKPPESSRWSSANASTAP